MNQSDFMKGLIVGRVIRSNNELGGEGHFTDSAKLHVYLDPDDGARTGERNSKNAELERGIISGLVHYEDFASWTLVRGERRGGASYYSWDNNPNGFYSQPFRIVSESKTSTTFRLELPDMVSLNGTDPGSMIYIQEYTANGWQNIRQVWYGSNWEIYVEFSSSSASLELLQSWGDETAVNVEFISHAHPSTYKFPPGGGLPTNKRLRFQLEGVNYAGSAHPDWPDPSLQIGPFGRWGTESIDQFEGFNVSYSFKGPMRLIVDDCIIETEAREEGGSVSEGATYDKDSFLSGLAVGMATEGSLKTKGV